MPLQTNKIADSIRSASIQTKSLCEIQENEANQQKLAILQNQKKPIQILEIEERAIQEMQQYYREICGGENNAYIVVRRAQNPIIVDPDVLIKNEKNQWQSGNLRKYF